MITETENSSVIRSLLMEWVVHPDQSSDPGQEPIGYIRPSKRLRIIEGSGAIFALVVVPSLLILLPGVRSDHLLALIGSTALIESGAPVVGVALGLPPAVVLVLVCSVALGLILLIYTLLDTLDAESPRVSHLLVWVRQRYTRSKTLQTYGIYGLVPGMVILGVWICPPIAWLVGWERRRAVLLMMIGFTIAAAGTLAVATGLVRILPAYLSW
ncbi:hypothetical protein Mpal_0997 [Methanosphaerula palustris E1-9c]|uniref:Uncharacterized protein n=2 Tax=Methanosphaerula palustris TaxID=475088 RepID=B8GGU2_METPE|nr:hypothetical protein Mpal_0997 [Methanosphaerula palustris E1-9c]